jgi:hypothetical protein
MQQIYRDQKQMKAMEYLISIAYIHAALSESLKLLNGR